MTRETPYTEIPNADRSDIGKVALYCPYGNTLAIEDTLEQCLATAERCTGERIDPADVVTDNREVTNMDLVATEIIDEDAA